MPPNGNERFNAEAAAWDSNPDVHRASESALQAILAAHPSLSTPPAPGPDVLEIGCGTGLLTLRIAPYARSVVAVDAAHGMVDALTLKLADPTTPRNVTPLCCMLVDPDDGALPAARDNNANTDSTAARMRFDLVLSHLVLHHIADLETLLATVFGCLKSGGEAALTDFEDFGAQARRFHPESKMQGVERHGIHAATFADLMSKAGFVDVAVRPAWTMRKNVERWPGEWDAGKPEAGKLDSMDFPFLLCRGRKP